MELLEYVSIIRRWFWLILLATIVAAVAAFVVSCNIDPTYEASTTLLISQSNQSGVVDFSAVQTSERLASTYAQRLRSRPVLEEVISTFALPDLEPDDLAQMITIQAVRNTQLVQVVVENSDPELAADIANAIPEIFARRNQAQQIERYSSSKDALSNQMAALQLEIANTEETLGTLEGQPDQKTEASRLQTSLAQYQQSYSELLGRYEEIRLLEAQAVDNIIVDEPAVVPDDPVRPRKVVNTVLAAAVGGMLAVGIVFLLEYMDDTVKSPQVVESVTGQPTLGVIAEFEFDEPSGRLETVTTPRSPIAEAYRSLRTSIHFSSIDRPPQTMVITSANPSEGKSTTAANLAVVLAQSGRKTVLVDADLRRPTVHDTFQLPNAGLTNALLAPADHDSNGFVQQTDIKNLSVLTAGTLPPNPAELLSSERMRQLTTDLLNTHDVLIFDTPPILSVTDAAVLSAHLDGVLLVIRAGRTRQPALEDAIGRLERVGAHMLGVVLTGLNRRSGSYYYYSFENGSYDGYFANEETGNGRHETSPSLFRRKSRS